MNIQQLETLLNTHGLTIRVVPTTAVRGYVIKVLNSSGICVLRTYGSTLTIALTQASVLTTALIKLETDA